MSGLAGTRSGPTSLGVAARRAARIQLLAFKLVFAFAMLAGLGGGLMAEEFSETAEWVVEHKLLPAPSAPRRLAHRPRDRFRSSHDPVVAARPIPAPLPPVGHTLSNGLRAPLRC